MRTPRPGAFARDNVTFAVTVVSALPKNLTLADLRAIYRCESFASGFPVHRDLYMVIPHSAVSGTAVNDRRLRSVFVGGGSLLCSAVSGPIGQRYGFRPHPSCGSTSLQTP